MKRGDMPASPTSDTTYPNGQIQIGETGMTIRERMAMELMSGILANKNYDPPRRERISMMAVDAIAAADALLAELERTGGGHG